jgi:V8-like Glu-specific endopeptidase
MLRELESELATEYEVFPPDTRICVQNTTVAPFRYICSLDKNGLPWCSGTLIGPRTVLTAGHCLNTVRPSDIVAIPGRNGASRTTPLGNARAVAFHLAPGQADITATDYGVIILDRTIGNRVGWWTFDHFRWPGASIGASVLQSGLPLPASSLPVNIAGYPGDRPNSASDPCFDASQNLRGMRQYRAFNTAVRLRGGILEYLNDTFRGMSGSPVWVRRDPSMGGRVMVAIHISRDVPTRPDVIANRGILIRGRVLEFVRAHSFYSATARLPARPLLRSGSQGASVRELQYRLNIWIAITPAAGLFALAVDSQFGPRTLQAVRAFQQAAGLTVDGMVGPQTWSRLLRSY